MQDDTCETADVDWASVRAQFPAVERCVYLNAASGSPLSRRAANAAKRYYDEALAGGELHFADWSARVEAARRTVGRAIGGPAHGVAFLAHASEALDHFQTLAASCKRERPGIAIPANDFPSLSFPSANRGAPVVPIPFDVDGRLDYGALTSAQCAAIGTLVISHVHFRTGVRFDLDAARAFADAHGMLLIVDATQSVGVFPIEADRHRLDGVVFSAYKWPAAGYGVGVFWLRDGVFDGERLPIAGWRSARKPYALATHQFEAGALPGALEAGHAPFAAIFALDAALTFIEDIGREAVTQRVLTLAQDLRTRLSLPPRPTELASGIVSFSLPDAVWMKARLLEAGIMVTGREGQLRVSPSFYNNSADLDSFCESYQTLTEQHAAQTHVPRG